jgi:hypothetical protein
MTKDDKDRLVNQIMVVLDGFSEEFFIHKPPMLKKSDSLNLGWGKGKKTTINFVFQTVKPTRAEVVSWVKGYVERMSGGF